MNPFYYLFEVLKVLCHLLYYSLIIYNSIIRYTTENGDYAKLMGVLPKNKIIKLFHALALNGYHLWIFNNCYIFSKIMCYPVTG